MSHNLKVPPPTIWRPNTKYVMPEGYQCDICFGIRRVFGFDVKIATDPFEPSEPRRGLICEYCLGEDGGLMTTTSAQGLIVYRCGTPTDTHAYPWSGRIVIVPHSTSIH